MNKLYIIGNGFDLAHGLPTKYSDFVEGYLKYCNDKAYENEKLIYRDKHIALNLLNTGHPRYDVDSGQSVVDYLSHIRGNSQFAVKISNMFIQDYFKPHSDQRWADIEQTYFKQLVGVYKTHNYKSKLKKLNDDFEFIKRELENYLLRLVDERVIPLLDDMAQIFQARNKFEHHTGILTKTCVVNFNYTKLPHLYVTSATQPHVSVINIHGEIGSQENPIIFGYGDDSTNWYQEMKASLDNDLLTHMKSHQYLRTSNHSKLLEFISNEKYEVYIVGHSCGLSDRVLLNRIIDSDQCERVKIYYYENFENYQQILFEVSRLFENEGSFREKLVDYSKSQKCPQVEDAVQRGGTSITKAYEYLGKS